MAIRLIKGRLQKLSNVCKNKITKEDSMLTGSEIFETSMSWAWSILEACAAISERKVSSHACVWFQR